MQLHIKKREYAAYILQATNLAIEGSLITTVTTILVQATHLLSLMCCCILS